MAGSDANDGGSGPVTGAPPVEGSMEWVPRVLAVPLIEFLGARLIDQDDPAAGLSLVAGDECLNAAGVLHGGVMATLLDLAAYLAVLPTIDASQQAVTHAFSASYLSSAGAGETIVVVPSLLRRSRRLAFATVTMTAGDRLVATATVTKSIVIQR